MSESATADDTHVHTHAFSVNVLPEDKRLLPHLYGGWVTALVSRGACPCGREVQAYVTGDGQGLWLPTLPTPEELVAFGEVVDLERIRYDGDILSWQFNADEYHPECIRDAAGILPGVGAMDDNVEYAVAYVAWLRGIDLSAGDPCSQTFPVPNHKESELWYDPRDFDDSDFPEDGKPRTCGGCLKPLPESAQ